MSKRINIIESCFDCSNRTYVGNQLRCVVIGTDVPEDSIHENCPLPITIENKNEYILCAAIHYDDKEVHPHQCKNIVSGIVVAGRRHHNCITTISVLSDGKQKQWQHIEGFITNTNRFVNRKEAYQIARASGQFESTKVSEEIYSEDIW